MPLGMPSGGLIGASSGNGARGEKSSSPRRWNAETGTLGSVAFGSAPPGRAPVLPLQFPAYTEKT